MYRLLLVSDREEVRSLYERYSEWENLGFERPVIASDAEEGIEQLSKGRFDAGVVAAVGWRGKEILFLPVPQTGAAGYGDGA